MAWLCVLGSCNGKKAPATDPESVPQPAQLACIGVSVNGISGGFTYSDVNLEPEIQLLFSTPVGKASASKHITLKDRDGGNVALDMDFGNDDSTVTVKPSSPLNPLFVYILATAGELSAKNGSALGAPVTVTLATSMDTADKFPRIPDDELLTLVQRQTFRYFWDFGHPVSGMARERSTSGNTVTTGGTGFGVMAAAVAVERGFITREQALDRLTLTVDFLTDKADRFHGAFPHWLNGETG
ncbi:MAG: beta-glucosidase, partial [Prevotellaceae bacterium]|nr:beta-glucosidase [Prevotellaceae bacterium]